MKSLIRWAIRNAPTMNTLMAGCIALGLIGLFSLRREVFPEFDLEMILVTVPYPGASPAEVEEGICQRIEEAVQAIAGIKKINSLALEGSGTVVLELHSFVRDPQRVLNEVRAEIDRIPSFPELAEDPVVKLVTIRRGVIRVGVVGPDRDDPESIYQLREIAEQVREALLDLPSVSVAEIIGSPNYQIDVEVSENTLREYGLTLQQVADIIRRQNVELPGGTLRGPSQEVILRGKSKYLTGHEIAQLPLITHPDGVVLKVGDVARVRDHFVDTASVTRINRRPGVVISIEKTSAEDLLAITREVKDFIAKINTPGGFQLPPGYEIVTWDDLSVVVAQRLELLTRNGIQGLILVFLLLALFLDIRLAFWVAMGLPVAIFATCGIMYMRDDSLNMMSMFSFLVALGILVDDGIVIGENIFTHRRMGKSFAQAAYEGTLEVLPAVYNSVATTIVAFLPLLFVPGIIGKFIAIFPVAVITMLVISLLEATFILPCHLGHEPKGLRRGWLGSWLQLWERLPVPVVVALATGAVALVVKMAVSPPPVPWQTDSSQEFLVSGVLYGALLPAMAIIITQLVSLWPWAEQGFRWLNQTTDRNLRAFIDKIYTPFLRWAVDNPFTIWAAAISALAITGGVVAGGILKFNAFPKLDANNLEAQVIFPDGTPEHVTDAATRRLEEAIWRVHERLSRPGRPLVRVTHRSVGETNVLGQPGPRVEVTGSHTGAVGVEIVDLADRDVTSEEVIRLWRQEAGSFPGAESVIFRAQARGPGGTPIEFKLLAPPQKMALLEQVVELCKQKLAEYPGVFDIADDSRVGKWELQVRLKDSAKALGVTLADVAGTLRAAYYGEEVMRLQRGRHEVKLMVRYPREERYSLTMLNEIRIRTRDGQERPLGELAEIVIQRGYSRILRQEQRRAITVTADVDQNVANAQEIVNDFQRNFLGPLLSQEQYRGITARWEGMQEQTNESLRGLRYGFLIALVAMYALLTVQFRCYGQPFLIMLTVPFGLMGAAWGHLLLGYEVSLLSLFGMVALAGVVVNDSIVLVDFINKRLEAGSRLRQALIEAGRRRLRAILLTSVTTIGGMTPLILERSLQAQFLIPMAISLSFGLMASTIAVLVVTPVLYLTYHRLVKGPEVIPEGAPPEQWPEEEPVAISEAQEAVLAS
ncbi:MAG: efflux RND transporter permease subunit [Thermoguttaceae bacterium]|nr:efflux RND transporter permease subunit [Thermoguttaceae bacterium]MDW8079556.1 efflux RND transporter permease subunit [Thermoguttaceae bacterium]